MADEALGHTDANPTDSAAQGTTALRSAKPARIQLSRAKGWRMPPNTVKVDRSTGYGNPFTVTGRVRPGARAGVRYIAVPTVEDAIECFREMLTAPGETADAFRSRLPELRGKNLACWCKLGEPCHADVLLELANAPAACGADGQGPIAAETPTQPPGCTKQPTPRSPNNGE